MRRVRKIAHQFLVLYSAVHSNVQILNFFMFREGQHELLLTDLASAIASQAIALIFIHAEVSECSFECLIRPFVLKAT